MSAKSRGLGVGKLLEERCVEKPADSISTGFLLYTGFLKMLLNI
jgi:hypothetical protein